MDREGVKRGTEGGTRDKERGEERDRRRGRWEKAEKESTTTITEQVE